MYVQYYVIFMEIEAVYADYARCGEIELEYRARRRHQVCDVLAIWLMHWKCAF